MEIKDLMNDDILKSSKVYNLKANELRIKDVAIFNVELFVNIIGEYNKKAYELGYENFNDLEYVVDLDIFCRKAELFKHNFLLPNVSKGKESELLKEVLNESNFSFERTNFYAHRLSGATVEERINDPKGKFIDDAKYATGVILYSLTEPETKTTKVYNLFNGELVDTIVRDDLSGEQLEALSEYIALSFHYSITGGIKELSKIYKVEPKHLRNILPGSELLKLEEPAKNIRRIVENRKEKTNKDYVEEEFILDLIFKPHFVSVSPLANKSANQFDFHNSRHMEKIIDDFSLLSYLVPNNVLLAFRGKGIYSFQRRYVYFPLQDYSLVSLGDNDIVPMRSLINWDDVYFERFKYKALSIDTFGRISNSRKISSAIVDYLDTNVTRDGFEGLCDETINKNMFYMEDQIKNFMVSPEFFDDIKLLSGKEIEDSGVSPNLLYLDIISKYFNCIDKIVHRPLKGFYDHYRKASINTKKAIEALRRNLNEDTYFNIDNIFSELKGGFLNPSSNRIADGFKDSFLTMLRENKGIEDWKVSCVKGISKDLSIYEHINSQKYVFETRNLINEEKIKSLISLLEIGKVGITVDCFFFNNSENRVQNKRGKVKYRELNYLNVHDFDDFPAKLCGVDELNCFEHFIIILYSLHSKVLPRFRESLIIFIPDLPIEEYEKEINTIFDILEDRLSKFVVSPDLTRSEIFDNFYDVYRNSIYGQKLGENDFQVFPRLKRRGVVGQHNFRKAIRERGVNDELNLVIRSLDYGESFFGKAVMSTHFLESKNILFIPFNKDIDKIKIKDFNPIRWESVYRDLTIEELDSLEPNVVPYNAVVVRVGSNYGTKRYNELVEIFCEEYSKAFNYNREELILFHADRDLEDATSRRLHEMAERGLFADFNELYESTHKANISFYDKSYASGINLLPKNYINGQSPYYSSYDQTTVRLPYFCKLNTKTVEKPLVYFNIDSEIVKERDGFKYTNRVFNITLDSTSILNFKVIYDNLMNQTDLDTEEFNLGMGINPDLDSINFVDSEGRRFPDIEKRSTEVIINNLERIYKEKGISEDAIQTLRTVCNSDYVSPIDTYTYFLALDPRRNVGKYVYFIVSTNPSIFGYRNPGSFNDNSARILKESSNIEFAVKTFNAIRGDYGNVVFKGFNNLKNVEEVEESLAEYSVVNKPHQVESKYIVNIITTFLEAFGIAKREDVINDYDFTTALAVVYSGIMGKKKLFKHILKIIKNHIIKDDEVFKLIDKYQKGYIDITHGGYGYLTPNLGIDFNYNSYHSDFAEKVHVEKLLRDFKLAKYLMEKDTDESD